MVKKIFCALQKKEDMDCIEAQRTGVLVRSASDAPYGAPVQCIVKASGGGTEEVRYCCAQPGAETPQYIVRMTQTKQGTHFVE